MFIFGNGRASSVMGGCKYSPLFGRDAFSVKHKSTLPFELLEICKISSASLNCSGTNPNQFCHEYIPFFVGFRGSDGANVAANSI
uniref:Uncharacterized protein n=1 Tax=Romanomermis culicivorax TaxID=13658 RepID=A0A915K9C7_ROMCU